MNFSKKRGPEQPLGEIEKKLTGTERIWETAKEEIISKLHKLGEEETMGKIEQMLDDPNFKIKATREWEKIMANTDDPEEAEKRLSNGLLIRVLDNL